MKKRDFLLIAVILIAAGAVWLISSVYNTGMGGKLRISVDNQEYGVFNLTEDRVISIGDTNKCQIKDGKVSMLYGECPDQVCVHSAAICQNGQTIICMPNRVVLEIIDSETDDQIDTIVK